MIDRDEVEAVLDNLVDELAAIEHERWAHWQLYMHSLGERQEDGSLVIPSKTVERWERQAAMAFADLSQQEQDSDREQVQRYLPLIKRVLSRTN